MSNEKATRERIVEHAARLFAERGFRDTTVADICAGAKANIAAVNYHFGNKDKLYEAVWGYTRGLMQAAHPVAEFDANEPEDWLCAFVLSRVRSVLDEGPSGWFSKIVGREMAAPSPMLSALTAAFLRPGREQLAQAVRATLGPSAAPVHVQMGMMHVLSLYAFLNARRRMGRGVLCHQKLESWQIEQVAEQAAAFAIAGLHGVRTWLAAGVRD